jgi:parallel beta-helix repeat protein
MLRTLVVVALGTVGAIAVGALVASEKPEGQNEHSFPSAAGAGTGRAEVRCDRFAAPSSDADAGNGSLSRPYRTAQKLVAALTVGQTGCLRAGTYSFAVLELATPDITLAPYRDAAVTLEGDIKVLPGAAGAVIQGMTLNGSGGKNQIGPRIYADRVVLRHNDITNEHTGICVHVSRYYDDPAPQGVVIEGNRIHDCGELPATNHDHGIYLADARDTIVRGNWIYDNADRGIQQYPDVQGSLITENTIDSNGQGVNFSGDDSGNCSNNNVVEGNVIANSTISWNVYSGAQGAECTGNIVRDNCVFASNPDPYYNSDGGIETPSRSFTAEGNVVGPPRYVDRASGDLRLRSESPCLDVLG